MLWRRTAPTPLIPQTTPVPDAEALRLALLQASWQRGRWVARRRVAGRWLLWVLTRYLLPALAVFGLAVWLWQGWAQQPDHPLRRLVHWGAWSAPPPAPVHPPAQHPARTAALAAPADLMPADAPPDEPFNPEGDIRVTPLALRLDTRWGFAHSPAAMPAAPPQAETAESDPSPALKPENWLHSKEP